MVVGYIELGGDVCRRRIHFSIQISVARSNHSHPSGEPGHLFCLAASSLAGSFDWPTIGFGPRLLKATAPGLAGCLAGCSVGQTARVSAAGRPATRATWRRSPEYFRRPPISGPR